VNRRAALLTFVVAGLAVCLALVLLVAPHASNAPDGLIRIAADHRLDSRATPSPAGGGPLAGYQVHGVTNSGLARGIAGCIGVIATFAVSVAGTRLLSARRSRPSA
jgi:hypothetical protein